MEADPGHALVVSLDGPGIEPETVDTRMLLEVALAYVNALAATAEDVGLTLGCTGIRVISASAGVRCVTYIPNEEVIDTLNMSMRERVPPPYAREVLAIARRLPNTTRIKIANDNGLICYIDSQPSPGARRSRIAARVRVIRAGGATPAIRVQHVLTDKRFTLVTSSQDDARILAHHLYQEIDIVADVSKHSDGRWTDGRLVRWHQLQDIDPALAWREWFSPHAEHWRAFPDEDLRVGLGRDE